MSEKTEKPKTIEQRMKDYHPKFLEAIKDTYPLAVLGSLCIAISAFSSQNYTNVQVYAISAASMFLIAFTVSFAFKVIEIDYFAFISYISTGLAIVFLFAVIVTFAQDIPEVSRSLRALPNAYYAFLYVTICYFFYRVRIQTKPEASYLSHIGYFCSTFGIILTASLSCLYIFESAVGFTTFSPLTFTVNFLSNNFVILILALIVLIDFVAAIWISRKIRVVATSKP